MSTPAPIKSSPIQTTPPVNSFGHKSEAAYQEMDAELAELIAKTPDSNQYPSRELTVANAYIKKHSEFENSRTEVYARYVIVFTKLRDEKKLPEQNPVAPPPPAPAPAPAPKDGKKPPAGQAKSQGDLQKQPIAGKAVKKPKPVAELKTTPPAAESRQRLNGAFIREIQGERATMLYRSSFESFRKVSPEELKRMIEVAKKIEAEMKEKKVNGATLEFETALPKTESGPADK